MIRLKFDKKKISNKRKFIKSKILYKFLSVL